MSRAYSKIVEKVPPLFNKRAGDTTQEGGNNTLIVLGTDRPGKVDSGLGHADAEGGGKGAGTVHIIAGRKQIDPDFETDASFVYISQKTKSDENLKLKGVGPADADSGPAVIAKSDDVRLVARQRIKISLDGGAAYVFIDKDTIELQIGSSFVRATPDKVIVEGGTIELGGGAKERTVLGDTFMNKVYKMHQHPTAVGPSGVPLPTGAEELSLSDQTLAKK